jgi:hypothetical protein
MWMQRRLASRPAVLRARLFHRSRWAPEQQAEAPQCYGRPWQVAVQVNLTRSPPRIHFCTQHDQ